MIVMKFGGTSVESAEAIERITEIVKSRLDRRPVVVVSAMGKTTNRLLKTANRRIVLISPYLKLRPRVRELIEDAARLGL